MNERELQALRRKLLDDVAAIDRVLELARAAQSSLSNGTEPIITVANKRPSRVRGVRAAMLQVLTKMSGGFDKDTLISIFAAHNPVLASKVDPRSVQNTIRDFVKEGYLAVSQEADGDKPRLYDKGPKLMEEQKQGG